MRHPGTHLRLAAVWRKLVLVRVVLTNHTLAHTLTILLTSDTRLEHCRWVRMRCDKDSTKQGIPREAAAGERKAERAER
jgi:hypothetical protein